MNESGWRIVNQQQKVISSWRKDSWPKLVVQIHSHFLVLKSCGSLMVISNHEDNTSYHYTINNNSYNRKKNVSSPSKLKCFGGEEEEEETGELIADFCRFLDTPNLIVVVCQNGKAWIVDWKKDEIVQPLDCLREQPGSPTRGKIGASFKLCCSGKSHLVLVDQSGQAWSWGEGPQTGLVNSNEKSRRLSAGQSSLSSLSSSSEKFETSSNFDWESSSEIELVRIDFLQGLKIISISAGNDFNLALVEHISSSNSSLGNSNPMNDSLVENQDDIGSNSDRSSCPLGLPLESKNATQKNKLKETLKEEEEDQSETVQLRKKKVKIPCKEESRVNMEKAERLAQSGLYINPNEALKYLSDQLKWMGKSSSNLMITSGGVGEGGVDDPIDKSISQEDVKETLENDVNQVSSDQNSTGQVVSSLYKATSGAVADSVKYVVGQTVSRLSYSFSTSTDDRDNSSFEVEETPTSHSFDNDKSTFNFDDDDPFSTLPRKKEKKRRSHLPLSLANSTRSLTHTTISTFHRRSQSASVLDKMASNTSHSGVMSDLNNSNNSGKMQGNIPKSKPPKYEVWFWGHGQRGQAGQGDMMDRLQPGLIACLTDLWIQKVTCSSSHCLALTRTGRVYGWGENSSGQSSPKCKFKVCSSPGMIDLPVGETACDIAVSGDSSFILADSGALFHIGPTKNQNKRQSFIKIDLSDEENSIIPRYIMSCGNYLCCRDGHHDLPLSNFKSMEKLFLLKLHEIFNFVVEPICLGKLKSSSLNNNNNNVSVVAASKNEVRTHLHSKLERLMEFVASSVINLWHLSTLDEASQLSIVRDVGTFEEIFNDYNRCVGDCLVSESLALDSQEFVKMSPIVLDILQKHCHVDTTNLGQNALATLVANPVGQLKFYCHCLSSMTSAGRRQKSVRVLRACDLLENTLSTLRSLEKTLEKEQKAVEETKKFWDLTGTKFNALKTFKRRVLLNSKDIPISVANSGSFNKNWIILMNDLLIHAGYSAFIGHPLKTMWIENHQQGQSEEKHEITLIMPEDTIMLAALDPETKNEWFQSLQKAILESLKHDRDVNSSGLNKSYTTPPIIRKTKYVFHKIPELKGAEYNGNWMQGRMHGQGVITWPDGRVYRGQFRQNQKHGNGRLEVKSPQGITVYDGQWKADKFEGKGKVAYANGDNYEGMLKDGKPHGQGMFKQGKFMGTGASIYIGEWSNGLKQGYGVSDDIVSGEKYMGLWSSDMKSGPGCVVTSDGVYYEGTFAHNKMTGKGLMLFEDETSYEGNFADAGVFSGHGCLSYENGDRLEGSFYGNYSDGMKFNGTIFKNKNSNSVVLTPNLVSRNTTLNKEKIGKFTVDANRKWTAIFQHFHSLLAIPETGTGYRADDVSMQSPAVWEQLAILINQSKNNIMARAQISTPLSSFSASIDVTDGLELIPDYSSTEINSNYIAQVNDYLTKAFCSSLHPLRELLMATTDCFNATYGGVRVHPRLLKHSVQELESIVFRIYEIVRFLFPALPEPGNQTWLVDKEVMVSASSIIYPHILPTVHSSIFMLYALYYKKDDDEYWARIVKWNKHPDIALLSFLEVNQKFWNLLEGEERKSISLIRDQHFYSAIETLQQLKTKFTPFEKLTVILETFREVNRIGQTVCGSNYCWSMDDLFPVFQYIVVRARILQLGAEIHMIEDLMESYLSNGEYGIMFTTLQAGYYQILKESISLV